MANLLPALAVANYARLDARARAIGRRICIALVPEDLKVAERLIVRLYEEPSGGNLFEDLEAMDRTLLQFEEDQP